LKARQNRNVLTKLGLDSQRMFTDVLVDLRRRMLFLQTWYADVAEIVFSCDTCLVHLQKTRYTD